MDEGANYPERQWSLLIAGTQLVSYKCLVKFNGYRVSVMQEGKHSTDLLHNNVHIVNNTVNVPLLIIKSVNLLHVLVQQFFFNCDYSVKATFHFKSFF